MATGIRPGGRRKPWTGKWRTAVATAVVAVSCVVAVPRATASPSSLSEFTPCAETPQAWCATLTVPQRWDAPDATRSLHLTVVKWKATATGAAHKGVLLVDEGGPNGGSADSLRSGWYEHFTAPVRAAFDIVAVNQRESAVHCEPPQVSNTLPLAPDPATFDDSVKENARYAESCRPETLWTIDSLDRARDLDALRRGLGVDRVSYYGVSYGTVAGQALAELHPTTVRSVVLDSPQYPRLGTADYLVSAAAGIEDIAHGFAGWCQAHRATPPGQGSCRTLVRAIGAGGRITARRVLTHLRNLRSWAEAGTLYGINGEPVSPDDLTDLFSTMHLSKDDPQFLEGRADELAQWRPRRREATAPRAVDGLVQDTQTLLRCNDFFDRTITTYEQWQDLWQRSQDVAPLVRTSSAHWTWMRACLGTDLGRWRPEPFPSEVPLLVTAMRYDSPTPHGWARQLATDAGAPLVTYNGFGHGAYDAKLAHTAGRECVARPVEEFLVDGVVPADTRCQGATAVPGA
ncbi:alpha/beta hydrolase [Saccharothrix sp. S26]|uniref:alpha/beta hydrolase n=1 Tax=Saccharothrix sp. S26 TaxID=2907215 RepID=UPI001F4832CA|nr:alpha/beta fold hydrolase [Saccharothrix sp. S26]MCE6995092.1 alpha/beta hydrolase [Saccharothrix sp. S26]